MTKSKKQPVAVRFLLLGVQVLCLGTPACGGRADADEATPEVSANQIAESIASANEELVALSDRFLALAEEANSVITSRRAVDQNNWDVLSGLRDDGLGFGRRFRLLAVVNGAFANAEGPRSQEEATALVVLYQYVLVTLQASAGQMERLPPRALIAVNGTVRLLAEQDQAVVQAQATVTRALQAIQDQHGVTSESVDQFLSTANNPFDAIAKAGLRRQPGSAPQRQFLQSMMALSSDAFGILESGNQIYESMTGDPQLRVDRGTVISCSGEVGTTQDYQMALMVLACLPNELPSPLIQHAALEIGGRANLQGQMLGMGMTAQVEAHVRRVQTFMRSMAEAFRAYDAPGA